VLLPPSDSPAPGKKPDIQPRGSRVLESKIEDEARFLRSWFEKPLLTGAVSPSGRMLARCMARYVDPFSTGPVVELGPGTGPVTEALLRRGVAPSRLVLVEFNPNFVTLLRQRFPGVRVVEGDAYDIARATEDVISEPAAAVVSSLPLLTKPESKRVQLLGEAFSLMKPNAPFVQFTYRPVSPMPKSAAGFTTQMSPMVWLNLPPARVFVYRRPATPPA
jgi:phosphatidylethanolamine/phosphatidyl-N-methylethanolamine N-methyltransferase